LLLAPGGAAALRTAHEMRVEVDEEDAGSWRALSTVRDMDDACLYRIRWSNNLPGAAARTVRCDILEAKVGARFDCQENRLANFVTSLELGPICRGFDSFLQQITVEQLNAAEHRGGVAGSILISSSDDLLSFEVSDDQVLFDLLPPPSPLPLGGGARIDLDGDVHFELGGAP
jgi:hypothetical protein